MNHHKLKHCETNFWCQLPAWSVWGLWQTSSAFLASKLLQKERKSQSQTFHPTLQYESGIADSLGKVVRVSLGGWGEAAAPAELGWDTVPHGISWCHTVSHGATRCHLSPAQHGQENQRWVMGRVSVCISAFVLPLTSHNHPVTHSLLWGFANQSVKRIAEATKIFVYLVSFFSPPNNNSTDRLKL